MVQHEITPGSLARSLGMGLFAGALFVLAAFVVESSIVHDFSSRK